MININKQYTYYINWSNKTIQDSKFCLSEKQKTDLGKFLTTIEEVGKSITESKSSTDTLTRLSQLRQTIAKSNKPKNGDW